MCCIDEECKWGFLGHDDGLSQFPPQSKLCTTVFSGLSKRWIVGLSVSRVRRSCPKLYAVQCSPRKRSRIELKTTSRRVSIRSSLFVGRAYSMKTNRSDPRSDTQLNRRFGRLTVEFHIARQSGKGSSTSWVANPYSPIQRLGLISLLAERRRSSPLSVGVARGCWKWNGPERRIGLLAIEGRSTCRKWREKLARLPFPANQPGLVLANGSLFAYHGQNQATLLLVHLPWD